MPEWTEYKFSDLPNPIDLGKMWAGNLKRNATLSVTTMSAQNWIRIVAIVGAYILLRPYILKLAEKTMTKHHSREIDPDELAGPDGKKAAISPNDLRGLVNVPDDTDDEAEKEGKGTGADWGKKARRRQRQMVKKILDEEERIRREFEELDDDKDIEQYLT